MMNDLTLHVVARTDAWLTSFTTDEEGSQALEAAGAALAAMAIVFFLRNGAGFLGEKVEAAMRQAATAIGF